MATAQTLSDGHVQEGLAILERMLEHMVGEKRSYYSAKFTTKSISI